LEGLYRTSPPRLVCAPRIPPFHGPCHFDQYTALFNKHPRASFIPSSILGIAHDYPNLTTWLNQELAPEHEAEFRKAEKTCFDGNEIYKNQDIGKFFKRGLNSLYEPMPLSVLELAGMKGISKCSMTPANDSQGQWDNADHQRPRGMFMR
jgi:hypothetical protein